MKKLFYLGALGLVLFEIAKVYLIMPMPGSQRMDSLQVAYFLHHWRWVFRLGFGMLVVAGGIDAFRASRWGVLVALAVVGGIAYETNIEMTADKMFVQPKRVLLADAKENKVPLDKLVVAFADMSGVSTAYPIQFLGYHHQILDKVGATPVMVTYCNVCRTGRIFSPLLAGKQEKFRLVGMDHFNAMFEDATTGSWWRQATGEAVAGPLEGIQLTELPSSQTTLREWFRLHPNAMVMQADSTFAEEYADMDNYDVGLGRGPLTGTDTLSWNDKSWVVGVQLDAHSAKAYDWNRLKRERVINDTVGNLPVVVVLGADDRSFFAFRRPEAAAMFRLQNDSLMTEDRAWKLTGLAIAPNTGDLQKVSAYQEFWHSWRSFHPYTTRY